jgi:adenine phosphoribosyltransferase
MKLTTFITSLKQAPIIKKGEYHYVIHPITDGIPEITPDLLKEVTQALKKKITAFTPFDKLVTMEAMGIPLASALSLDLNIPFTIIRKRSYGLADEQPVNQQTGYSESTLFINGLKENDSVIIVDDVLSTGGTLRAVLHTLDKMGVIVKAVFVAVDKGNVASSLSKETKIPIQSLVHIQVSEKSVYVDCEND